MTDRDGPTGQTTLGRYTLLGEIGRDSSGSYARREQPRSYACTTVVV